jgi:hypothetical protein
MKKGTPIDAILGHNMLELYLGEPDPETGLPPIDEWPNHRLMFIALGMKWARSSGKRRPYKPGSLRERDADWFRYEATPADLRAIAALLELDEELDRHKLNIFWAYMDAFGPLKNLRAEKCPTLTEVQNVLRKKFGQSTETRSIRKTLDLLKLPVRRRGRGRPNKIAPGP